MRSKPSKCRVLCRGLLVCTPCCSRGCYGQGEVVVGGPAGSCWALGSGGEPRGESKPKAAQGAAGVGELLSGGGSSTLLLGCLIWHGTAGFGMAWHGTAQDGLARFSTPQSPTREMPRAQFPHARPAVGSTGLGSAGKFGGGGTRGNVTAAEGQGALCGNSARGKLPPGTLTPALGPAGVKRLLERGQEQKTNLLFFGNYEVTNYQ